MDQVAVAMESIKQASTQNVAGAKQLEMAARNLNDLGQRLKQMVERYKV
jgi:methyl-accepting chemotaxis protein